MVTSNKNFFAYQNEIDSLNIGNNFIVKNSFESINIYGSLELTKDKEGLKYAYALKRIIDSAIEELKSTDLPEHVESK